MGWEDSTAVTELSFEKPLVGAGQAISLLLAVLVQEDDVCHDKNTPSFLFAPNYCNHNS